MGWKSPSCTTMWENTLYFSQPPNKQIEVEILVSYCLMEEILQQSLFNLSQLVQDVFFHQTVWDGEWRMHDFFFFFGGGVYVH